MLTPETPTGKGGSPLRVRRMVVGLAGLLLFAGALAIWFWPHRAPPAAVLESDDEIDRELEVVNPGYVGIETCGECHAKRAGEFKTSRHYLACRTAAGVAAPGFAPGRGRCDTRFPGLRFEMTRSGDDFFATAVQETAEGETRTAYQVGLV